jgi:hypothetical protein
MVTILGSRLLKNVVNYTISPVEYYSDPVDCLTAHLILECSEVLAGVKPANLISLVNRTRSFGRNLYQLWNKHHQQAVTRFIKINFLVLQSKERALLILCYDHDQLDNQLAHAGIRALLCKSGYDRTASVDELLAELKQRVANSDTFPHEIGLFIGYPAKDVAAFMGLIKLPLTCQGPWKIYGNPHQSLHLMEQYRCCRQKMCHILATGSSKVLELNSPEHPFFSQTIDNKYHNHRGFIQ